MEVDRDPLRRLGPEPGGCVALHRLDPVAVADRQLLGVVDDPVEIADQLGLGLDLDAAQLRRTRLPVSISSVARGSRSRFFTFWDLA